MDATATTRQTVLRDVWRLIAVLLAGASLLIALRLHEHEDYGRAGSWVFVLGFFFGWILQRSRFCFFCLLRDYFEDHNSRAVFGILAALAVGVVGHTILFTAWIPNALAGHMPPRAHIGPVSWVTALGGLVFGMGMSLSGSCISAHLYRLGEGSRLAPISLVGALGGAILGMMTWNPLYLNAMMDAPVVWLPGWQGFTFALVLALVAIGAVAAFSLKRLPQAVVHAREPLTVHEVMRRIFVERWKPWAGGVLVGLLSTAALFRGSPLGVTAEINRLGRMAGDALSVLPMRLEGLDVFRGCRIAADTALFTPNGLFIIALVIGGFVGAAGTGEISPSTPKPKAYPLALLGGVMLGWGGFTALGCTIGTLLSGIHAGALSGWVFAVTMLVGVRILLPVRQWAER